MNRAFLHVAFVTFAVSCKPSTPAPADAAIDASTVSPPIFDAAPSSSAVADAGKDADDTVAMSNGKIGAISANDTRTMLKFLKSVPDAGDLLGGGKFVHQAFMGNFGPSPRTLFGIMQAETMSPYVPVVVVVNGGTYRKVEADPLTDAQWNGWSVDALMFEDIDANGVLAPIVIAEYMTGIGPTGAQPFVFVSVYRYQSGKMVRAGDIEKILSGAADAKTVRARLAKRVRP